MKITVIIAVCFLALNFSACAENTNEERRVIDAASFQQKIEELSNEQVLDVRSVEEFAEGHVPNALNVDWNAADFEDRVAALDKEAPVMVYCYSGGRSAEAANKLQQMGFATIYEMEGGLLRWGRQGLPTVTEEVAEQQKTGMSKGDYDKLVNKTGYVLVDFYADWCKPCKQMEPMLQKLAVDEKGTLEVVRINADDHEELTQLMAVDALPTLILYRDGKKLWSKVGLTDKAEIMNQVR